MSTFSDVMKGSGGGILSGLFGLGSTLLTNRANRKLQDSSNKFNADQAQLARDFNASEAEKARTFNSQEAATNREFQRTEAVVARDWQEGFYNQYESPAAKMRQYQDSGLNPALMYQGASGGSVPGTSVPSGGAASGSAASGSGASSVAAPYLQASEIVGSIVSIMKLKSEIDNINADTRNKNASASGQEISNDYSPELFSQQLERGEVDIKNGLKSLEVATANIDEIYSRIRVNNSNISRNEVMNGLTAMQTALAESSIELNGVSKEKMYQEINNLKASENLTYEEAALTFAKTFNTNASTDVLNQELVIKKMEAAYVKVNGTPPPSGLFGLIGSAIGVAGLRASLRYQRRMKRKGKDVFYLID